MALIDLRRALRDGDLALRVLREIDDGDGCGLEKTTEGIEEHRD
jgi:hypothetical protein